MFINKILLIYNSDHIDNPPGRKEFLFILQLNSTTMVKAGKERKKQKSVSQGGKSQQPSGSAKESKSGDAKRESKEQGANRSAARSSREELRITRSRTGNNSRSRRSLQVIPRGGKSGSRREESRHRRSRERS